MKNLFIYVGFSSLFLLAGCGGGGSGGDGSVSTGVRMLHASIEASPVELSSTASENQSLLSRFTSNTAYMNLPEGEQQLSIHRARFSDSALFVLPLNLEKNKRHSVLLFGDLDNGLRVSLFDDYAERLGENEIALRLVHGLTGASQIRGTFGGAEIANALDFGSAAEYVVLPHNSGELLVRREVDSRIVFAAFQELAAGQAYTIVVSGEVDYLVLAPIYQDN